MTDGRYGTSCPRRGPGVVAGERPISLMILPQTILCWRRGQTQSIRCVWRVSRSIARALTRAQASTGHPLRPHIVMRTLGHANLSYLRNSAISGSSYGGPMH